MARLPWGPGQRRTATDRVGNRVSEARYLLRRDSRRTRRFRWRFARLPNGTPYDDAGARAGGLWDASLDRYMGLTVNRREDVKCSAPCEIWQWQSQAAPKSVGGKVAQSKGQPSTCPPLRCCVRANNAALGSIGGLHLHAAAHWRRRAGLPCGLLARDARLAKKARSAHPGERRPREALLRC